MNGVNKLIEKWHEHDKKRAAGSSGPACSASLDTLLRELHGAVEGMMEIVEGCRGERWTANGRRLVDTPEWCRLYVARCAVNRYEQNAGGETWRKPEGDA